MVRYQPTVALLVSVVLCAVVNLSVMIMFQTNNHKSYKSIATSTHHHHIDNERDASFLVLHVGPPKVASTTIQDSLDANEFALARDKYVYLGLRNPTHERDTFGVKSGLGEFRENKNTTLLDKLEEQFLKFPKTNYALSSESFSIMPGTTDENGIEFFELLKKKVNSGRQVRIAVGYRRYFAWVVSIYNQRYKTSVTKLPFVPWYISNIRSRSLEEVAKNSLQVYQDMKKYFKDVTMINLHDGSEDAMSQVYCNTLPKAPNICKAYKERLASPNGEDNDLVVVNSNPSTKLWPRAIAREAESRGLISLRSNRLRDLERQIAQHAKNINYTSFPQKCLSQQDLDYLLEISLSHEQQMLPDFYASPLGEETLRKEFQAAIERDKFCSVDAEAVLNDKQWQLFFSNRTSAVQ